MPGEARRGVRRWVGWGGVGWGGVGWGGVGGDGACPLVAWHEEPGAPAMPAVAHHQHTFPSAQLLKAYALRGTYLPPPRPITSYLIM